MDVQRNICLNVLFAEMGWIRLDSEGKIIDWDVYCLSNGMSALIFLKNPADQRLYEEVYKYLKDLMNEGVYGFSEIYTEAQARIGRRFGGQFSFVIETDGYTAFGDDYTRPLVKPLTNKDYRFGRATHGYLPEKGPQPILLAKGPDIKENICLSGNHIVNEAPTYAKILGFTLPDADGNVITEILR